MGKDKKSLDQQHSLDQTCRLAIGGTGYLVLLGIKWYWVGIGLFCLYVLKKEIWLDVTRAGRTINDRTRKDRATQPMDHGRLR